MLKSMTAYGRSSTTTSLGKVVIEINSINKRHFELQCALPSNMLRFDGKIRTFMSQQIHRGQVFVKVTIIPEGVKPPQVHVNVSFLEQYALAWRTIANTLGYSSGHHLPLELFVGQSQLMCVESEIEDEEALWRELREGLEAAWKLALETKLREGKVLQQDLMGRCHALKKWRDEMETKAKNAPDRLQERLKERIEAAVPGGVENAERLMREMCIYADKVDMTEESVRLKAHLDRLESLLLSDQSCVGKELEFLLQEITREINTASAKSPDIEVINLGLLMKAEVEKLKEQVQNIE